MRSAVPWYRTRRFYLGTALPGAVVIVALTLPLSLTGYPPYTWRGWLVYGGAIIAAICVAPRWPKTALAFLLTVLASQSVQYLPGSPPVIEMLPLHYAPFGSMAYIWIWVALFSIAASTRGDHRVPWLLAIAVPLVAVLMRLPEVLVYAGLAELGEAEVASGWTAIWPEQLTYELLVMTALTAGSALLGALTRAAWVGRASRRALDSTLRTLNLTQRRLSERTHEHALAEERQHIAGEVHDTLAHSLTVVLAQAEGALHPRHHSDEYDTHQ
ncbi:MAG: hypothetical protein J0H64_10270, partial [Actinobacteria bacterium]|nr:hypothetical protein [Actinomycetota bacterium]